MTIQDQWYETGFELSNGTKFTIYHNLPEVHGLSIGDAFENWLARTGKFTAKSFVKYILSKETGHYAFTEHQWNKLNQQTTKQVEP